MTTWELSCREVVEQLTDYLEQALPAAGRGLVEEHLVFCANCDTYLEQLRRTIRLAGLLREQGPDTGPSDDLLAAFRRWQSERAS
jgi:anti-sigma factor RsiW